MKAMTIARSRIRGQPPPQCDKWEQERCERIAENGSGECERLSHRHRGGPGPRDGRAERGDQQEPVDIGDRAENLTAHHGKCRYGDPCGESQGNGCEPSLQEDEARAGRQAHRGGGEDGHDGRNDREGEEDRELGKQSGHDVEVPGVGLEDDARTPGQGATEEDDRVFRPGHIPVLPWEAKELDACADHEQRYQQEGSSRTRRRRSFRSAEDEQGDTAAPLRPCGGRDRGVAAYAHPTNLAHGMPSRVRRGSVLGAR